MQSLFVDHPAIAETLLEIALKAAILCLAVGIAHVLAGRKRLLLRSALWHMGLVGLLLIPMTVVVTPRMRVSLPFAGAHAEAGSLAPTEPTWPGLGDELDPVARAGGQTLPAAAEDFEIAAEIVDAGTLQQKDESHATASDNSATSFRFGNMAVVSATAFYFLTFGILLIRLVRALAAVAALQRAGSPVANPAWILALERWQSQFVLRSPVKLLVTESVGVPIVLGWRRPAIVLPTRLAETTDQQAIDAVLLHELTHVARNDYAWNVLLRIVYAIYWPHPFVWFAGRMIRQIREEVCDAVCVHWMGGGRNYCAILVDVAAGLTRSSEVALGMAMTPSSQLGRRLARVQQTSETVRGLSGRPTRAAIAVLVISAAGLLGTVQVVSPVSAGPGRSELPVFLPAAAASALSPGRTAADDGLAETNSRIDRVSNQDIAGIQETKTDKTDKKVESLDKEQPVDASPVDEESKPPRIVTAKVQRGTFRMTSVQPATLEPFGQVSIHSRNAGIVSKVRVDVGDRVKAGAVLAELDFPEIGAEITEKESAVAQAEAAEEHARVVVEAAESTVQSLAAKLTQAEAEGEKAASYEKFRNVQYDRVKKLAEAKSIDERLVDEKLEQLQAARLQTLSAVASIASAKAVRASGDIDVRLALSSLKPAVLRVATARLELKRTMFKTQDDYRLIRSPIDGVVLEKNIDVDVNVKSGDGQPLFRLAGTGLITAVVQLPQRDALLVKLNNPATVKFVESEDSGPISGKVSRIAYRVDPATATLRTEIAIPNADGRLKPGMFVQATIVIAEIPDVLWVPTSAVGRLNSKGAKIVCVRVVNGRALRTPVKMGRNNGSQFEVVEGLSEGEVIVVDFQKAPPDGEPLLDPILLPAPPKTPQP
jgi:RND family efflux transporter MFP subunit